MINNDYIYIYAEKKSKIEIGNYRKMEQAIRMI